MPKTPRLTIRNIRLRHWPITAKKTLVKIRQETTLFHMWRMFARQFIWFLQPYVAQTCGAIFAEKVETVELIRWGFRAGLMWWQTVLLLVMWWWLWLWWCCLLYNFISPHWAAKSQTHNTQHNTIILNQTLKREGRQQSMKNIHTYTLTLLADRA